MSAVEYPAQRLDPRDPEAILRYVVANYIEPKSWVRCACYEPSGVMRRNGSRCLAHIDAENARWALDQTFAAAGAGEGETPA